MPAEWAVHECCWMIWPCRADSWPSGLEQARRAFAEVALAICHFEPVKLLARQTDLDDARRLTQGRVDVVTAELDDCWARDTGPTFLLDPAGALAGLDWGFNGWGLVHRPFDKDARVARLILERAGARRFVGPMILEGGSIHVDGEGTLLATEECLLDPERNPHLTKADIEDHLRTCLGVDVVIWLRRGLTNDETRGHIDNLACFSKPGEVLLPATRNSSDPDCDLLREAWEVLASSKDAQGRSFVLRTLPCPPRRYDPTGRPMALSYVNFYLPNGGVVMPGFDPDTDAQAIEVLEQAFPGRAIVVVPGHAIAEGGGNVHCITQQQPRSTKRGRVEALRA